MNFTEYQEAADRTANRADWKDLPEGHKIRQRLTNFALGLTGEAGETADLIKKFLFHGQELDSDKLKRELGDVMWYIAGLASTMGWTIEEIAELNIAKLKARYPEGFSSERSTNRDGEAR